MLRPGINSSLKTPKASGVIKPFLAGRDLKRYQTPETCNYLITLPKGWTREMSGGTGDAITWFKENYPAVFKHLEPFTEKLRRDVIRESTGGSLGHVTTMLSLKNQRSYIRYSKSSLLLHLIQQGCMPIMLYG